MPLSPWSLALYQRANRDLLHAQREAMRRRGTGWMTDPAYQRAEQAYDNMVDQVAEWKAARDLAKQEAR